ncbi:hypothetical protein K440DRAFT_613389 [Wilcoxina mikolae CBS 423.85]|nr:hypothetical protein K440DRAFT_613389 [Wilcoxina mikolae CBS 423.85]
MPPKRKTRSTAGPPRKRTDMGTSKAAAAAGRTPPTLEYIEFWTPHDAKKKVPKTWRPDRIFRKGESDFTNSPAKISLEAYGRLCDIYNAVTSLNPGGSSEGCGILEVFRGQLWEYERLVKKKSPQTDVMKHLWPVCEAMAFFFVGEEDEGWLMVDDADDIAELVALFGGMYLDCLGRLEKLGLLVKDWPIQNLGLVMGIMCSLGDGWDVINHNKETAWTDEIADMAKEKGIEMLDITYKIEPYKIQEHEDPPEENGEDKNGEEEEGKEKGEDEKEEEEEEEEEEEKPVYDFLKMMTDYKKQWGKDWNKTCIDLTKPSVKKKIEKIIKDAIGTQ